jgi:hypothetical protein
MEEIEEIQLKVEKAYPIDLGRGTIRLDPATLLKLQLSPGDIVEIKGKKKTTAKAWRADRQDWDQGFMRIDNFIRQNAGVSIGEKVTIKKVEAPEAKKLILALPESMIQGGPELQFGEHANEIIKRRILKRPVFRGDIVPIINSMSQPITEALTTSQVVPLVAVETEPSNTIVEVSEETEVDLIDIKAQGKVAQNSNVNNKPLNCDIQTSLLLAPAVKQLVELLLSDKKDDEVDIIAISEAIVKNKDHYDKIVRNIKEFNTKYDVGDSTTLSVLENLVTKSDKAIYEYIYTLKLKDALNYINELESKLETYHRVALSEIAHRKIKEIEFQISSPLFFSKSRKSYRKLGNELVELDNDGIQGTKEISEFILTSEQIIKKAQEAEDDLEDEKRTGIYHTISNCFIVGFPIIIGIYQLIAAHYLNMNPLFPIIGYILLCIILYVFLKSGSDLKIVYSVSVYNLKDNIHFSITKILYIAQAIIIIIIMFIYIYSQPFPLLDLLLPYYMKSESDIKILEVLFALLVSVTFSTVINFKNSVKKIKSESIRKEIDSLITKYEHDSTI